jgi:hypothetical protein
MASNSGESSASMIISLLPGEYPATLITD